MRRAWLVLLVLAARPALAGVVPDPGGAGAWATAARCSPIRRPLTLFDAPARLGSGRFAFAAQRARLFELDDLGRTRVALGACAGWAGALGYETFGPGGAAHPRGARPRARRACARGRAGVERAPRREAQAARARWMSRRAPASAR
jgi:hypothetical protein